jgi:phytanoyl-CoA hydroxylase
MIASCYQPYMGTPYKSQYQRDGFIAIDGLVGSNDLAAVRSEAVGIIRGERGPVHGAELTGGRSDEALLGDVLAIHHPHKLSKIVTALMAHEGIVEILKRLIGHDIKAMQTMLFVKKAGKPGQAWHQDEHFIATRDRSLCGVWIALDDATVQNGCLWMHPGSHSPGILYPVRAHNDERFDASAEAYDHPYERNDGVAVEVKAGGVVFFNGYVLHRSLPNLAPAGFRRALVTHYMSAHSLLPWAMGAALAPEDVRDIVMIAGNDPYAWKGTENINIPYVRPDNAERAKVVYAQLRSARGQPA